MVRSGCGDLPSLRVHWTKRTTTRVLLGMLEKEPVRFRDAETKPKVDEKKTPSHGANGEEKKEADAEHRLRVEVEALIALGTDEPAKVLGVDEDADITQVKSAYQKRVLQYHPDRHSALTSAELKSKLSHLLALASEALDVLSERKSKTAVVREAVSGKPTPPPPGTETSDETDSFDKEKHGRALFRHAEQVKLTSFKIIGRRFSFADKPSSSTTTRRNSIIFSALRLIRNKKWRKEAAVSLKKAVELDENNPLYLGLLAALYQAQGLQLRADKIFDQVTKIDPSYEIPQLPAWASSADRGLGGLTLAQVLV